MKALSLFPLLAVSLMACTDISLAADKPAAQTSATKTTATPTPTKSITVAELYTSQGCSSCPPAEKLFSTLADNEELLTLEWHVDYWDDLVHGGSRWKDVYSSEAFTNRQRAYNRTLRGTGAVYTPQAIINGQLEGVGSRPGEVSNMLENAPELPISVAIDTDTVSVGAGQKGAEILFVRLLEKHETNVKGGENKGRKLAGKNIVLEAKVLGQTGSTAKDFNLPLVGEGETCAVLVQPLGRKMGAILGAAKCL